MRPSLRQSVFAVAAFGLLLTALPCSRKAAGRRAFFHWRTTFALSPAEKAILQNLRIDKLYVRFFDVQWDDAARQAVPVARCTFREPPPPGLAIVPVVFLKNDVFRPGTDPAALAAKVWNLVCAVAAGAPAAFGEVQVDCDWTDGTRPAFFAFCRALKRLSAAKGAVLSATIRLHQVKYRARTGVPPVDRGLLMFYNVGRLEAHEARCSIFNAEDAARYTPFLTGYPLPLDAALAIFSWVIHRREGRIVGLMEKTDPVALKSLPFLRCTAPGRFTVITPAFFHGTYLRPDDVLAVEAMTPALAREAAAMLHRALPLPEGATVSLFDLDERNLRDYRREDLEALFTLLQPE